MPGTISGAFRPSDNIHNINEFKANFLIFFKACLILVPQEKMGTLVPKVQVLPRTWQIEESSRLLLLIVQMQMLRP